MEDFTLRVLRDFWALADSIGKDCIITREEITIGDFKWIHQYGRFDEQLIKAYGAACAHYREKLYSKF